MWEVVVKFFLYYNNLNTRIVVFTWTGERKQHIYVIYYAIFLNIHFVMFYNQMYINAYIYVYTLFFSLVRKYKPVFK